MNDLKCTVLNPNAFKENQAAQRQLAAWLVRFGLENGTIKTPYEKCGGGQKQKPLHVRHEAVKGPPLAVKAVKSCQGGGPS